MMLGMAGTQRNGTKKKIAIGGKLSDLVNTWGLLVYMLGRGTQPIIAR